MAEHENRNPVEARAYFKEAFEKSAQDDVETMERLAIGAAALGDIPLTVDILQELWHLEPFYRFHNSLPFVRVADLYEEQRMQAEVEGGADSVRALNATLSNITRITQRVLQLRGGKAGIQS